MGIKFVPLATVVQAAEGLTQEHIDAHGAVTLLPKSKEPFASIDEIMALLNSPEGTTWPRRTFSLEAGEISFIYFSHIFPGIWGHFSKFLRLVTVETVVTVVTVPSSAIGFYLWRFWSSLLGACCSAA